MGWSLTAFINTRLQIVFDGLVNVVYNLHSITSKEFEIHGLPEASLCTFTFLALVHTYLLIETI